MNIRTFFLVFLPLVQFLLFGNHHSFADGKRALKLLEKQKFDRLEEHLDKSLEKDSINPGARYVYALLLVSDEYTKYHLDSANIFNRHAAQQWPAIETKAQQKLIKAGIDSVKIMDLQAEINRRAFARAIAADSIYAYQYFIDHFKGSQLLDSAVSLRNQLAFEKAAETDTYESYKSFMDQYPDAQQYEEAKSRYEKLYFIQMTQGESLEDYQRFLDLKPDSPYRKDAERNILEIATADNLMEGYEWFMETYPDSYWKRTALSRLYYQYKLNEQTGEFFEKWKNEEGIDSIRLVYEREKEIWLPFFEEGFYGFLNTDGSVVEIPKYRMISEPYYCGGIESDLLWVDRSVVNRQFYPIVPVLEYDQWTNLGHGTFTVQRSNGLEIWHKSGKRITNHLFDTVQLLSNHFIVGKRDGFVGIYSFLGRKLWKGKADKVICKGRFIIFEKEGKIAVATLNDIAQQATSDQLNLRYILDDTELITENLLLVFSGDEEGLMASDGSYKINIGQHTIYSLDQYTIVRKEKGFELYDQDFEPLYDQLLEDAVFKNRILAVKKQGLWAFTHTSRPGKLLFYYDSVRLMGEKFILLRRDENLWANFDNDTLIQISYADHIRVISSVTQDEVEYLMVKDDKDRQYIFNERGKLIIEGDFDAISPLGEQYIVVEIKSKKGLYYYDGTLISKPVFDAIGNEQNGFVNVLKSGKFGLINHEKGINISPDYEKMLRPYNEKWLIATKKGKRGLIDHQGKTVLDYEFDNIEHWNDSLAIVQMEGEKHFYEIGEKKIDERSILKIQPIAEDNEGIAYRVVFGNNEGIYHNTRGPVIKATFNIIKNLGSYRKPLYFAEKYVDEAEFYVVIYYDKVGTIVRKQVFSNEEYDLIYCD